MLSRIILAIVVAILVGLGCTYLLGPILISLAVPFAVTVGDFLVKWGWTLGGLAGLWHYFGGSWIPRR